MQLHQVKSALFQTEAGAVLPDNSACSEPILSLKDGLLIDNFFVYLVSMGSDTITGPIARLGLQADSCTLDYLTSCTQAPFSLGPRQTLSAPFPTVSRQDYDHYAQLYTRLRSFAYKEHCAPEEKQTLAAYLAALEQVVPSSLMPLYREMSPAFFAWANSQMG